MNLCVRRPRHPLAAPMCAVFSLVFGILGGCGSNGPQILEEAPLDASRRPTGVVLLPVGLAIPDATALDIVANSNAVARWLLERTNLPVVGPFDFGLNKAPAEVVNAAADTDLLARQGDPPVDFRSWLALHLLVTENRATNVRDIVDTRVKDPKQPNTWRQRGFESRVRVELRLADPMRGQQLALVVLEGDDDPTDVQPGADPRPGVTRLIQHALERLIETAGPGLQQAGARRTRGEGLVDSVPAMLAWGAQDMPSYQQAHRDDPDVVREAAEMGMWDRFAPGLSVRDVRNASATKGVLVRTAHAPLEAGDVILTVAQKPVSAAHQVDRLLQGCGAAPCAVLVLRGGQRHELQVRWPVVDAAQAE